jgi:hypothetical protein
MGCCGGGGRPIRRQAIGEQSAAPQRQPVPTRRVRTSHAATPVSQMQQYAVPRHTCPHCGHPAIAVHIAKRERIQCSNQSCKLILK